MLHVSMMTSHTWRQIILPLLLLLLTNTRESTAQCNGPPLYLGGHNSSGHIAFPEANFDPESGQWQSYQLYPTDVTCTWVLRAPQDHILAAAFLHFDTEKDYDYVTLYSDEAKTDQLLQVSGNLDQDYFVTSPDDTLVLEMVSDDYTTYGGFLLAYRYEPRACIEGGVTIAEDHLIAVPPRNLQGLLPGPTSQGRSEGGQVLAGEGWTWSPLTRYAPWLNCTWRLALDPRALLHLEIITFDTAPKDDLTIWQVNGRKSRQLLQYGGSDVPRASFQSSKPLLVSFVSGNVDRGAGFLLNVTYIMRACEAAPQELVAPRGLLAYPLHNLQDEEWRTEGLATYGPDTCQWVVRAPQGYAINLTIQHFDTLPDDQLQILDGGSEVFTHGGGMPSRSNFVSRGSELTLKFNPERDTDHTGFLIHYSWLLRECGGVLPMDVGEVRSPYYPDTYGPSVNCTWTITPPQGHLVHLLLARLRLDQGDALQVMSGGEVAQSWGAGQGSSGHLVELRPQPQVTVSFTSDKNLNLGYFSLKYQSFRPGSCDFSISPCGWQSTDPLQAWAFHGGSGRVVVQEQTSKNLQLPRGYRATLTSPWITPTQDSSLSSESGIPMCFRLEYVLNGADAYLLMATLQQAETTLFGAKLRTMPLVTLHGPHGNASLTSAVNITVNGDFQISIIYERGYGPHYQAAISGVSVSSGYCGAEDDLVRAVTCNFTQGASFCAWANTHTDHTNWITDHQGHGLVALVQGSGGGGGSRRGKNSEQQWADLVSPVFNRSQLLEGEPGEDGSCFTLSYQLLTHNSELRVLVKSGTDEILKVAGGGHELAPGEQLLWAQGRVRSPQILYAQVTLREDFLAQHYQLVLRAVGVGGGVGGDENRGGVAVSGVEVTPGVCSGGPSCDFDKGFCSWRVSYTGGTVWYIRDHKEDGETGNHAAVLVEGGPGDTTSLTSEPISADGPVALAFRYKVVGTSKCLAVSLEMGSGKGSGGSVEVIWKQCRGKGHHWLEECIHIPNQEEPFQVVISADTGEVSTEVWVDDVNISAGGCNTTRPQEVPYPNMDQPPQWACKPSATFCGMTQPLPGHRDWVYVYAPNHGGIANVTLEEEGSLGEEGDERRHSKRSSPDYNDYMDSPSALGEGLVCRDGVTPLEETWICDGIPDCPDAADEEDCECMSPGASDGDVGTTCGNSFGSVQDPGSSTGMRPTNPQHLGSGVCAEGAFRCPSGRRDQGGAPLSPCLPRHLVCDGVADCLAQEDEAACERMHRPAFINELGYEQSTMVCSGGLNIPLAWRCDGIKDCPLDGLDEVGCAHCGSAEFICPTSGVCIPQQQVCDGAPSLPQCSDELMCDVCPPAHFVCDVCVTSWQICDGVWDCAMGEDERECHGVEPQETGGDSSGKCSSDQYRCPSGRCLPDAAVCDRHIDCPDADDEKHCLDDNFDVERYISVKPSPVAGTDIWGDAPSRMLTPTLNHPQGGVALLQFIYRLDAWLGPSNATLSLEVVDAEDASTGGSPWALWRQSGHKGRHWLKAKLLLPYRPNMQQYKLAFLVSNDEHPHNSQQLHIADVSYRVVQPKALHEIGRSLLQCEFEESFCGWSQITTEHGYSWVYAKASPHTRRTGPITGYPDGSGGSGFIFADSLHGSEGDVADLLSPPLMLPNHNATICFRFSMFLYGAHVAKVSVAALQRIGGSHKAPHTAELFHAKGAKGLSWIPVALQISAKDLGDSSAPFVLEVSATRGIGPEADIALDHVSIVSGGCSGEPFIDPGRTLLPALDHDDVYALAAGPALMPQPKLPPTQVPSLVVAAPDDDPCSSHRSCSSCVTAGSVTCSWCDLSSLCVNDTTPHAISCPKPLLTQHSKSTGSRSGPTWCPQLSPKQNISVVVPARSSPVLAFPVINIQSSQMDSGWTCVYQFTDNDEDSSLENDVFREGHTDILNKKLENSNEKTSTKKKEEVQMQGHYKSVSGSGSGVIKCGDGVTQLSPSRPRPYATVTLNLVTPAGVSLDNPRNVHVLVYDCSAMASSCTTCLTLNSSLACGWCSHSRSCQPKSQCSSEWRDSVCLAEESTTLAVTTTTTEASALNDLTQDLIETHTHLDLNKELKALAIEDMSSLLDSPDEDDEEEEDESYRNKRNKKTQKKKKKDLMKDKSHGLDNLEDDLELMGEVAAGTRDDSYQEDMLPDTKGLKTGGKMKKSGRNSVKGSIKVGSRGRAFLRLPRHPGIFVARDAWRLHTGRQYYVPVSKKTLINLGFVRQVTYGSLSEEKSRTVLINGAWKKAAGYFVDLFEKAGQDPVTSVVTTSRDVFEKIIGQLNGE